MKIQIAESQQQSTDQNVMIVPEPSLFASQVSVHLLAKPALKQIHKTETARNIHFMVLAARQNEEKSKTKL